MEYRYTIFSRLVACYTATIEVNVTTGIHGICMVVEGCMLHYMQFVCHAQCASLLILQHLAPGLFCLNTPIGNGLELCLLFTSIQIAMAATMNASTLIVETKRVIEYIRKQAEHGHSTASLLLSQASSLAEKIRTLPSIDVDQATDVLAAIEEGTWGANQIHIMVSAINASLVEGANRSVKKGNKNLQRNLHVENYLNNADWEAIGMFGASLHFVMRALSRRFRLCGIIHPSEKTFGRAASIIAHRHLRNLHPPPRLLFDLTADLKKCSIRRILLVATPSHCKHFIFRILVCAWLLTAYRMLTAQTCPYLANSAMKSMR